MTSIGTGYDLSNSVFSPDGRNFQVEYAQKAVENGPTTIGLRCKDGVILACEKLITSKLLVPGSNKRISTVDRHIGIATSGLIPDGKHFINRARDEAISWRRNFKDSVPIASLADRMGSYAQAYTLYSSVRPFGVTAIVAGADNDGPGLYMIEPSGLYWGYFGAATGKGRQAAKSEIEKLNLSELTLLQGIKEAARIIYVAHDDNKDKEFEIEMTWVTKDAKTANAAVTGSRGMIWNGWVHEEVPKELLEEAAREAKKAVEEEDEEDDDAKGEEKMDEDL
ncbi:putative proteasome subunit alpha type-7 [Orbilia ellipsospora]|uniref:Proteasome subunit alpha type n=1 Tax=Orbilia ellipsospora TaxID=2528407 RepID=A0AAV9X6V2_9PEZI